MMEDQIKRVMADVLGLEVQAINENTSMENTEPWDSLAQINLVSALEEEFGVILDIDEIEMMLSFCDVVEILERRV